MLSKYFKIIILEPFGWEKNQIQKEGQIRRQIKKAHHFERERSAKLSL